MAAADQKSVVIADPPPPAAATGRDFWVEDKYAMKCFLCAKRFHFLRRKHHCRFCGQIFCSECLVLTNAATHGLGTSVKVCLKCKDNFGSRQAQPRSDSVIQQSAMFSARAPLFNTVTADIESGSSSSEDEEQRAEELAAHIAASKPHLVLETSDGDASELIDGSLTISPLNDSVRPRLPLAARESLEDHKITYGLSERLMVEPNTVQEYVDKAVEDAKKLQLRKNTPILSRKSQSFHFDPNVHFEFAESYEDLLVSTTFNAKYVTDERREMLKAMEQRCSAHLLARVKHLVAERQLSARWIVPACDMAWRVVSNTVVDRNPRFDSHIDIVSVSGGSIGDSEIISGVAFFKNVTNRRMRTQIDYPRILLLGGTVGDMPVEGDFDLIEYAESYPGWLDKLYSRIRVWRPHVILVEETMHHFMQDSVLKDNITLFTKVPRIELERLERSTGATIVDDLSKVGIDQVQNYMPIGTCANFVVRPVGDSTLTQFEGLIRPTFTTIVLRGDTTDNLIEATEMMDHTVATAYHLTLQTHYLMDYDAILATVLSPTDETPIDDTNGSFSLPTDAHRSVEALTMNMGVTFPDEVLDVTESIDYTRDNIVVNSLIIPREAEEKNDDQLDYRYQMKRVLRVFPFYGEGDETVSEFIAERYSEGDSVRLFVHGTKKVTVVAHLEPREIEARIHENACCWTLCKECSRMNSPYAKSTTRPLSRHTLNMSFGALLEASLHSSDGCVGKCGHGLHGALVRHIATFPTDQTQFVVSIEVEDLLVNTIHGPRPFMKIDQKSAEVYFDMELNEIKECVKQFNARRQNPEEAQKLESMMDDIKCFDHIRQFRQEMFLPMVDEYRESTTAAAGKEDKKKKVAEDTEGRIWPADLYRHPELGLEFRFASKPECPASEPSSLIALALQAAADTRRDDDALMSPIEMSLDRMLPGGHRRQVSMSFDHGAAGQQQHNSFGDSPALRSLDGTTKTDSGVDDEMVTPLTPQRGSVNPLLSEEPQMTMEEIVFDESTANNLSANRSEFFKVTDDLNVDDAVDILTKKSKTAKKLAEDILAKFTHEFTLEDGTRQFVKVETLFPHQFSALRYLYTKGAPDAILHSLARCEAWEPGAGKSQADFFSTVDKQFILKAIKKEELQHFARSFHAVYFTHMGEMYSQGFDITESSSMMIKIMGVFTIHVKNRSVRFGTNTQHFILMENLFYDRPKELVYDLKGSQRNRLADATSSKVLLDENLVRNSRKGFFFYCTEEQKSWVIGSLTSDTQVLMTSKIMDYSLLVCVSPFEGVCTIGIVDFLRPYTLDKLAETVLKTAKGQLDVMIAGGAADDPTIIEPPLYMQRFMRWMGIYFCSVPEKLSQIKRKENADRKRLQGKS